MAAQAASLQGFFTVHDLRRTGSTLLHEAGFRSEWIEKCLAHEEGRTSRAVYNKAEYAEPRRLMLQEWATWWMSGFRDRPKPCAFRSTQVRCVTIRYVDFAQDSSRESLLFGTVSRSAYGYLFTAMD